MFEVGVEESYRKFLGRFANALLILFCVSLKIYAQSTLPQATTGENKQIAVSQTTATKFITPKYLMLGKTVKGRDITAAVYGSGKKYVLVFGGIHGDEPHTTVLARSLAVHINQDTLPQNLTVIIMPDVNPDGLLASTRVNANGVDINRNFPSKTWRSDYTELTRYPGLQPSSEPETRAVLSLIERYPPHLIITLHAALGCVNWDGPGGALAEVMAAVNQYPLCASLGYETPGSLGLLTGVDKQIPTVTIELRPKGASANVSENLPALFALLKHFSTEGQSKR